jgi:hypothetical protein
MPSKVEAAILIVFVHLTFARNTLRVGLQNFAQDTVQLMIADEVTTL